MISIITGKILNKSLTDIIVMTNGGVGYKIFVTPTKIDHYEVGSEIEVLTHLIVREDKQDLYGFETEDERGLFVLALSVSGIGPKSALHLLSIGTAGEIKNAIATGDADYISKVNGVGKKTAQRLVVELKEKVSALVDKSSTYNLQSTSTSEVVEALVSMGYKAQQAREVIKNLDSSKSSEELLREALKLVR